jgi:hypothetical protein
MFFLTDLISPFDEIVFLIAIHLGDILKTPVRKGGLDCGVVLDYERGLLFSVEHRSDLQHFGV